MTDDLTLGRVEFRIARQDGGRDGHSKPSFRKLNTSCADTIT